MTYLDRGLALLLLLGAVFHTYGTLALLPAGSEVWVWSLGAALAAFLVAVLNLLRPARSGDKVLVGLTAFASFAWALVAFGFGKAIGNIMDPRVIWHYVCGLGLGFMSLRALATAPKG
ncbi:MAG: hypothetical protein U1E15_03195 [Hyphomicrobiales bacterium]